MIWALPARGGEGGTELSGYLRRLVSDGPRREAQHSITWDPQGVLPLHVGPPFAHACVLATVDFDVYAPLLKVGVQVASPPRVVRSAVLKRRCG